MQYLSWELQDSVISLRKGFFLVLSLGVVLGLMFSSSLTGFFAPGMDIGVPSASGSSAWSLQIDTVNSTLSLSLDDLVAMPKTIVYADLFCYGQLLQSGEWGGVRLGFLLEQIGFDEQATGVQFYAVDGYTVTLSRDNALDDNVIIAYEKDGLPLPETVRLVVPEVNGAMWISMITKISLVSSATPLSPNPYPASIIQELLPTIQPSPTPTPAPTPETSNQPITQPVAPLPTSQPVEPQQDLPRSSLPAGYGYPILGTILVATAVASGYLFYKRRK